MNRFYLGFYSHKFTSHKLGSHVCVMHEKQYIKINLNLFILNYSVKSYKAIISPYFFTRFGWNRLINIDLFYDALTFLDL